MFNLTFVKATTLALTLALGAAAHAYPTLTISSEGKVASIAAESSLLTSAQYSITENFESFSLGQVSAGTEISTSVGDFLSITPGTGGACDNKVKGTYNCSAGLAILDSATTPFSGRFSMPEADGKWLDSMDAQEIRYTNTTGAFYNTIGFYMTDPNDWHGRISIGGSEFNFGNIFGSTKNMDDGRVFYITLTDLTGISSFSIFSNSGNDGYGIDNVSLANVPEPATFALFGLGLAGLVASRRRQKKLAA